jgi:hypothetical protein
VLILHSKLVGDGVGAESWQLTSPPYSYVGMKGPLPLQVEQAADGSSSSFFDPSTDTIHLIAGGGPVSFADPLATVRDELRSGRAQVLGTATTDGIPTYEIRFADKHGFGPESLVAFVDRRTYRPVLLIDPQRNGTVVRLRVVTLEYVSATPQNRRLLSLADRHPGARVVVDQSSKLSAGSK